MTTATTPPVDQAARASLLHDLDSTCFVEAGAGTGKTTTMVGRIVNLVATDRVVMENLVAITFTEAAAAELRDRVREGLERGAVDTTRPLVERQRCRQASEDIDLAAISTIHSFAGSLLRAYPLDAGLPPGFRTLDEIERGVLFEDRFKAWFWGAALEEPARGVLRRALLLGLTQDTLRALAQALEEHHDLLSPHTSWPVDPTAIEPLAAAREVGQSLLDLAGWIDRALDGTDDVLSQTVAKAQLGARRLVQASSADEAVAALQSLAKLDARSGQQGRWGKLEDGRNACAAIKAVLAEANARVASTLTAQRAIVFAEVLALVRDFVLAGVRGRRDDGVATFQDLLAWTRDLLRDHPDVRHRAQRRITRLFVDEFQDTDPLQAEIAFYLAADESGEPLLPTDWRDLPLVEGKLFVVGDPKQSIYRFRRADIALYSALIERMQGSRQYLVQNFRSLRPVIEWVNHHFLEHMLEEMGVQPRYIPLEARWEPLGTAECGVYRIGTEVEVGASERAAREANALAQVARAAVARGWQVSDANAPGGCRPARYRDVAILFPAATHLRRLERSLEEAGVPYRVESGTLLLNTQEVRDLLACLRAIEDPSDQVALVAALRSPAYACSDVDLVRWVEGGGRLDYERPRSSADAAGGPVAAALANLATFHARRADLSPPGLIEAFIADRLLVASAFGEPRPRDAWRRLRYVVGRARAFTATGRRTLRAFLDWIESVQRAEVREAESADAEPDEDAVRILTVHRSKGLEFPIVLLAGLGSARGGRSSSVEIIPDRSTGSLVCSAGQAWRSAGFEEAREREVAMASAEDVRLLYVATTRARDHLVLSLFRGGRAETSHAARIEARLAAFGGACRELTADDLLIRGSISAAPTADGGDEPNGAGSPEAEADWLAHRAALLRDLASAPTLLSPEFSADHGLAAHARQVRRLVRSGWATGVIRAETADEQAAAEVARTILASEPVARARQALRCQHAVPLLGLADGMVVDTTLDLVYEASDGMTRLVLYDLDGSISATTRAHLAEAFTAATGRAVGAAEVVP